MQLINFENLLLGVHVRNNIYHLREFALATYRRLGSGAVGRFGTGILVTISLRERAAPAKPAKLKIG